MSSTQSLSDATAGTYHCLANLILATSDRTDSPSTTSRVTVRARVAVGIRVAVILVLAWPLNHGKLKKTSLGGCIKLTASQEHQHPKSGVMQGKRPGPGLLRTRWKTFFCSKKCEALCHIQQGRGSSD